MQLLLKKRSNDLGRTDGFSWESYESQGADIIMDDLFGSTDVATIDLGEKWRMPTVEEFEELIKLCDWAWVSDFNKTGKSGYVVTREGYAGEIFFPTCGYYNYYGPEQLPEPQGNVYCKEGIMGIYRTRTCGGSFFAYVLEVSNGKIEIWNDYRNSGMSIRPVSR
ncbi:MAG: hypothetical protein MJZ57_09420 [Bacteroidales bacterium]|nr:hypothetical protein [Bacteroidales bacterium]